ncbi:hypothetical protein Tco_0352058, partial [Tanacetum coccineum]
CYTKCLVAQASNKICLRVDLEPDEWIKDSGCSKHMTGNRKLLSTYKAYNEDNVEHVDKLRFNLLSVGQMCDNKCRVTFSEHDSEITKDVHKDKISQYCISTCIRMATSDFSLSSKFFEKPPFSSMDNSKRIDDFTEKFSVFEVNYDGVFFKQPLSSSTGCDWIDERVGYVDRSLPDISKVEFSKEALLDDGGSSSATSLSFVLKRKGKSRVKFTRKRAIFKRSNYGSFVSFIGLNEDVCDDEPQLATRLSQTGGLPNNDFKNVDQISTLVLSLFSPHIASPLARIPEVMEQGNAA